jgi:branched-chain amino acid transport system ATP-binding protein
MKYARAGDPRRDLAGAGQAQVKATGQSILIVDKNIKVLSRIVDRHYVLEKGRVVLCGSSDDLRAHRELQKRYLGI